jgi:hypothetical protein
MKTNIINLVIKLQIAYAELWILNNLIRIEIVIQTRIRVTQNAIQILTRKLATKKSNKSINLKIIINHIIKNLSTIITT